MKLADCVIIVMQSLLRGLVAVSLAALTVRFMRRVSAARRAMVWQICFVGLALLPLLLVSLPGGACA